MTTSTPETDHERITRVLTHAEDIASKLEDYQDHDISEELKTRLRTASKMLRLLGKTLVSEIEHDQSIYSAWDNIVPDYIQRHSH